MSWIDAYDENQNPIQIHIRDETDPLLLSEKDFPPEFPWVERRLFYKNKYTGEICYGIVEQVKDYYFLFRVEGRLVRLRKPDLGTRVFRSEIDARNYGKTIKP